MFKKFLIVALASALLYRPLIKVAKYMQFFEELRPFRSNKCTPIPGPEGCESLALLHPFVFMACANLDIKEQWDAMKGVAKSKPIGHQDQVYVFNLSSRDITPLRIEGYTGELFTHGMDAIKLQDGTYWLFLVNHAFEAELINIFSFSPDQNVMKFERSIQHPLITSLNAVAAVSPHEFYVSNDGFRGATLKTFAKMQFGPPESRVYHVSTLGENPVVTPVGQPMYLANGIVLDKDWIYVADSIDKKIHIYHRQDSNASELELKQEVMLEFFPDNLSKGKDGSVYAVGFPRPLEFLAHFIWSREMVCSTRAVRVFRSKEGEFVTEKVFEDSSLITSGATSLVVDTQQRIMLLGLMNQRHIAICDY